ncbi:MAG: hypothetical protein RSC75_11540, partial [Bacteroidales bacterium]
MKKTVILIDSSQPAYQNFLSLHEMIDYRSANIAIIFGFETHFIFILSELTFYFMSDFLLS